MCCKSYLSSTLSALWQGGFQTGGLGETLMRKELGSFADSQERRSPLEEAFHTVTVCPWRAPSSFTLCFPSALLGICQIRR